MERMDKINCVFLPKVDDSTIVIFIDNKKQELNSIKLQIEEIEKEIIELAIYVNIDCDRDYLTNIKYDEYKVKIANKKLNLEEKIIVYKKLVEKYNDLVVIINTVISDFSTGDIFKDKLLDNIDLILKDSSYDYEKIE